MSKRVERLVLNEMVGGALYWAGGGCSSFDGKQTVSISSGKVEARPWFQTEEPERRRYRLVLEIKRLPKRRKAKDSK